MTAMALVCEPKLMIADEPTTALDVTTQAEILDLMKGLQSLYGMALMFVLFNTDPQDPNAVIIPKPKATGSRSAG